MENKITELEPNNEADISSDLSIIDESFEPNAPFAPKL